MLKKSKIMALLLVAAMLVSLFPMDVLADPAAAPLELVADTSTEGTVKIEVKASAEFTLANISLALPTPDGLELTSIAENKDALAGTSFLSNLANGSCSFAGAMSNTVAADTVLVTYEYSQGTASGDVKFELTVNTVADENGDSLAWEGAKVEKTVTLEAAEEDDNWATEPLELVATPGDGTLTVDVKAKVAMDVFVNATFMMPTPEGLTLTAIAFNSTDIAGKTATPNTNTGGLSIAGASSVALAEGTVIATYTYSYETLDKDEYKFELTVTAAGNEDGDSLPWEGATFGVKYAPEASTKLTAEALETALAGLDTPIEATVTADAEDETAFTVTSTADVTADDIKAAVKAALNLDEDPVVTGEASPYTVTVGDDTYTITVVKEEEPEPTYVYVYFMESDAEDAEPIDAFTVTYTLDELGEQTLTMPAGPETVPEGKRFAGWTREGLEEPIGAAENDTFTLTEDGIVYTPVFEDSELPAEEDISTDDVGDTALTGETEATVAEDAEIDTLAGMSQKQMEQALTESAKSLEADADVVNQVGDKYSEEENEQFKKDGLVALYERGLIDFDEDGNPVSKIEGAEVTLVQEFYLGVEIKGLEVKENGSAAVTFDFSGFVRKKAALLKTGDTPTNSNSVNIPGSDRDANTFDEEVEFGGELPAGFPDGELAGTHYPGTAAAEFVRTIRPVLTDAAFSFFTKSLSPFNFSTDIIATNGTKNYSDFQAAVNDAVSGDIITVLDGAGDQEAVVNNAKNITIDNTANDGAITLTGNGVRVSPTTIAAGATNNVSATQQGGGYTGGSSSGPSSSSYAVNVASVSNGEVTVSHNRASNGTTVKVTPTAKDGYYIGSVTVVDANNNTVDVTTVKYGEYTFKMPSRAVTVTVKFITFEDVEDGEYYAEAVEWAVTHNPQVTNGISDTEFGPMNSCTRAQMVTFLWRAAGAETPTNKTTKFTDIEEGSYYYNAVLWAVEKGITTGTTETTFSPNDTVTRAQAMTFIARHAGKDKADDVSLLSQADKFTDIEAGAYYYASVLWALDAGITKGTSETTFSPNDDCLRGMIVTLMYRYAQNTKAF